MITDNDATGGAQPDTASTAAPQTEKVETPAVASEQASTEEGKRPEAEKTEEQQVKEASEAAKTLNERKHRAKERVQQAVARQNAAEDRARRAEARVRELEGKIKPPNADEYTDPAKLTADQIDHSFDRRRVQDLKQEHSEAADDAQKARALAWHERVEEFKADNADFEQVAFAADIGEKTSLMVAEMEDGPAVAYHLGKFPAIARQIEALSERQRPFALGKIAAQVTAPPPKRITNAPSPTEQAAGKSGGMTDGPPSDPTAYAAWRKRGGGGRNP